MVAPDAGAVPARGDVYLAGLDPTIGSEMQKTRPCLIVAPDELAGSLRTTIVAPMTTGGRAYPWRVSCHFAGRLGFVATDQLRTLDGARLIRRLGRLPDAKVREVLHVLREMFAD